MGKGRATDVQRLEDLEQRMKLLETPKSELEPVVTDQVTAQAGAVPIDVAMITIALAIFPAVPVPVLVAAVTMIIHTVAALVAARTARKKVVPTAKL